jgi:hypothetical protein
MTDDGVHSSVVRWISSVTGATVIKAHQGGEAPALPYIMVNMIGRAEVREQAADIGYVETATNNSEGKKIVEASPNVEVEWRFSIHSYGPAPSDRLRPIPSAMKLGQVMEPLLPGLVVHDVSQIRNVPDWIENGWQPRAQIDVMVRGFTNDAFDVDVIDEYSLDIAQASPSP